MIVPRQQSVHHAGGALSRYVKGRWIVRRLAPDCSRVELTSMPTLLAMCIKDSFTVKQCM